MQKVRGGMAKVTAVDPSSRCPWKCILTVTTQDPALLFFIGIDGAVPKRCIIFVSQGQVRVGEV